MDGQSLRNLRDFLQLYNRISETCFSQCISSLHQRDMQEDEIACVARCADKHVNANQKIMSVFMEVQPQIVAKRVEKMELDAAEAQAKMAEQDAVESQAIMAAAEPASTQ